MAAPILRHYAGLIPLTTWTAVLPAVAANRALVVSKLTVVTNEAATFSIAVEAATPTAVTMHVVAQVSLAVGEIYAETGIVALAGERVWVFQNTGTTNTLAVSVFGQEVDNV